MPHHPPPPPIPIILFLLLSLLPVLPALPVPVSVPVQQQPFRPTTSSPPSTIPSFPEQSTIASCPIGLPNELFTAVRDSCVGRHGHLHRGKCCPVLATWLYFAYSDTALGRREKAAPTMTIETASSYEMEMPLLPDDSETCVDGMEKVMRENGVDLVRPNATCDVVYCFCGIRIHPLSCPQAFWVSDDGSLVGGERVKRLESDCLSSNNGTGRCSKCLTSLYKLKKGDSGRGNMAKSDNRTSKMRSRDCELMGLTWLLHNNRDAYISTVTEVMRALMINTESSDPQSCSLSNNGMPLAVDSVEIDDQSSSVALQFPLFLYLFSLFLLIMSSYVLPYSF